MGKHAQRRPKPPTTAQIAEHHDRPVECWLCGFEYKTERAHVVAFASGGSNDCSNYMLLCKPCHKSQPDALPSASQWAWLEMAAPKARASRMQWAVDTALVVSKLVQDKGYDLDVVSAALREGMSGAMAKAGVSQSVRPDPWVTAVSVLSIIQAQGILPVEAPCTSI